VSHVDRRADSLASDERLNVPVPGCWFTVAAGAPYGIAVALANFAQFGISPLPLPGPSRLRRAGCCTMLSARATAWAPPALEE
jgi:hypothetical protein